MERIVSSRGGGAREAEGLRLGGIRDVEYQKNLQQEKNKHLWWTLVVYAGSIDHLHQEIHVASSFRNQIGAAISTKHMYTVIDTQRVQQSMSIGTAAVTG